MLINEIVVIEEDLVSKIKRFFRKDFEYDKSKLKSVKLNNVEYKWENGNYFLPNGDPVDQNGSLYQTLVLDPKNSAAWKNITPAQATRLRKGLFKGTRTNIAKKVGMSGLGQQSRSNPKAGIGAKAGEWTGELIGKGIDSLAGVIANAIGGRKQKPGGGDDIDKEFEIRGWDKLVDPQEAPERKWKTGDKDDRKIIRWVAPRSPKNTVGSQETFQNIKVAVREYYMQKELGPVYKLPFTQKNQHPKYLEFVAKWKENPISKATPTQGFKNPFFGVAVPNKAGYNSRTTRIVNPEVHPFLGAGMLRLGTGAQGQGYLPNDETDRQRWLNMQDSEKGIEFLKGQVRSKNITIDQAGEVLQFVQGKHPSQEVKQPTTFQKAWKMWYVTSPQYQQALDKNKKERQKVQRQLDKVTQDNEKIKSANQQMPLNQRTPKKSFILGPDGKPASI